ncbi:MAG: SET domain-containing protein [Candidatus Curtissbacteria bacterium]|nr:SET domain-containing protein [Candidatus Curtissbacteria bacterium]
MDNPKVTLGTNRFGKCIIANSDINKDEVIAEFDGEIFEAERANDLPKDIADHVIQFEEHKWRDSKGIARYLNHSCSPNCGLNGLFALVAMQDIKKGEELTWDYDMSEDSDWRMACLCGSHQCKKIIGAFRLMLQDIREKYKGYISNWLVKKYHL